MKELLSHSDTQIHTNVHLHCLNISGQPSQPDVESLSHGEDLLEICSYHLSLNTESPVCCYCHTVLPSHGHDSPTIIRHNRLDEQRKERDMSVLLASINTFINL